MAQASHDTVLDTLGARIVDGTLATGQVLTTADLEQKFAVSRTVIREAIRVLESMGMVEARRRVGLTIRPPQEWDVLDPRVVVWQLEGPHGAQQLVVLTELRAAIEPIAARLSAVRASDVQRRELQRLASELDALGAAHRGDSDEYLAVDIAFHDLILDASGNLMLAAHKATIAAVLSGRAHSGLTPADPVPGSLSNHLLTADAIARGDADAAEHHCRGYTDTILGEVHQLT